MRKKPMKGLFQFIDESGKLTTQPPADRSETPIYTDGLNPPEHSEQECAVKWTIPSSGFSQIGAYDETPETIGEAVRVLNEQNHGQGKRPVPVMHEATCRPKVPPAP